MIGNGETVDGYRIVRRIGVGGMGEVFEVEHIALGTRYALKTFVLENGDAAFLRERFLAEGRALARIEHPNVARVFDLGVMPDGTAYFVMDLVLDSNGEPRTLADVSPDEFTDSDRLRWLESIASALDSPTPPLYFDLGSNVRIEMVECRGTSAARHALQASVDK